MPEAKIVFRKLDGEQLGGFAVRKVPLVSLPHYRRGTIWREGRCVADTYMEVERFDVDFSPSGWELTSRSQLVSERNSQSFSNAEYPLYWGDQDRCKLIKFTLADGKVVLIPCMEYFVRALARNMSVCRALATLTWPDVRSVLYDIPERDAYRWLVRPSPSMRFYDAVFLGHLLYDSYTEKIVKEINSQFTSSAPGSSILLEAKPWFKGRGELLARGVKINNGKTFLCLDILGASTPEGGEIIWERIDFDSSESTEDSGRIILPRPVRTAAAEELLTELSNTEPDTHAEITEVRGPLFKTLGKKRQVTKAKRKVKANRAKLGPPPPNAETNSGGVGNGSGKNVGKLEHVADAEFERPSFLRCIWDAFKSIKESNESVSDLHWYTPESRFSDALPLALVELAPIDEVEVDSDVRSWIYLDRVKKKVRGVLVVRMKISGQNYFCFEIQRNDDAGITSGGRAGLLMKSHVSTEYDFKKFVEVLCSRLRYRKGVFRNLGKDVLPPEYHIFNHSINAEAFESLNRGRLINAFAKLGVELI